ncbi:MULTISPECIES: diaminopimelate epimerase [Heyndrickxia]|jgi:diaminopimelate epimerase|uniref:Diaminopimelate epimerase n=1 Tax=Heyndrickxia oleronia TaxID=38875 RepID=A0A8E2LD71_9BACI|nr:diaminopimelate epimerase [Heyndrickxia oleronia]NYV65419.1 diaminopimelate epimerase [Bacillus sp. Gen3]OJH20637.1 diaminopimelate epimerase [Bacillus obstructivus]MCI1592332.1 diaminopimelate epimerase [Heyndrickxia oleronia]MCI1615223.1 diaminopimelate epimerase [Heyndrickxia oleronia]MCI1763315.1 diaminopimelate epimerase [Heyndrickxia oleronia]
MNINIRKCHGSGNDFLLIDEISMPYTFSEEDRQNLSITLCDRNAELGADGILFVMKSDKADAKMRVFNADGSEASMCGNGLRCVGRYVCELLQKDEIRVETMKAILKVNKSDSIFNELPTYCVEISPVLFSLDALPMNLNQEQLVNEKIHELSDQLLFSAVAVPNPHLITFVDKEMMRTNTQRMISEYVNGPNQLFPDGVNVSFVHSVEKGVIYVRTFERGVGFTNACGTAMSASSLISCILSLNNYEEEIDVYNNGGKVRCVVHKSDQTYWIELIGNATYLYDAEIIMNNNQSSFEVSSTTHYKEEQIQYEQLETHAKEYVERILF